MFAEFNSSGADYSIAPDRNKSICPATRIRSSDKITSPNLQPPFISTKSIAILSELPNYESNGPRLQAPQYPNKFNMAYSRSDLDSLMKQLVKLADVTPEDRIKFGKLLVIAIALLLITPIHATAEVIGLGHLPGSRSNGAFGISADGSVAAGADSADKQAVRRILASGKRPASGNRQ